MIVKYVSGFLQIFLGTYPQLKIELDCELMDQSRVYNLGPSKAHNGWWPNTFCCVTICR